jgi:hypothetical protein
MPNRVRHHTDDAGLRGIRATGGILASRGWGAIESGVHVEVQPFGTPTPATRPGQASPKNDLGCCTDGAFVEFGGMDVTLRRRDVVTLYRCLREADRSLHFLMNPARSWEEFLAYYHPHKRERLGQFSDQLLPSRGPTGDQPPRPRFGSWRFWLGKCFTQHGHNWAFPAEELAWIVQQGRAFLELLTHPSKPGGEELIARRERLRDAQILIEARCCGMDELKKAEATTHFDELTRQTAPSA